MPREFASKKVFATVKMHMKICCSTPIWNSRTSDDCAHIRILRNMQYVTTQEDEPKSMNYAT